MRYVPALLVAAALLLLVPGVAGASEAHQVKRLENQVAKMRKQNRSLRHQLKAERSAFHWSLSDQVAAVGRTDTLREIKTVILDPLRAAWPCEQTHNDSFGSYFWSVSLTLEMAATDTSCPWVGS